MNITIFIGLEVTLGYAILDTGAQHGVVGIELFKHLYDLLNSYGLKPRKVPTLQMDAVGVGGVSKFVGSYQMPVAIGGIPGILQVHTIA